MGSALVGGLIDGGWEPTSICVVEIDASKREHLAATFGVQTSDVPVAADGALVAVKPGDAADACRTLAGLGVARVLSIAAGVSVATLEAAVGGSCAVVRAMPNTPALVGEGVTAICAGTTAADSDLDWAESLLTAVGVVVRVPESQMDAVTAVAGSGPAYIFLLAESLLSAAQREGLPADVAEVLVRQLFRGSGILLAESNDSPSTLREKVTSPNGTTAAGLAQFEDAGLREIVNKVVRAAAARSVEMGRSTT
jgi:pyrroline-5-carboxylate reductase